MNYRLKFLPTALKEWRKLDNSLQVQFKKKLAERLQKPHVISAKLSGFENHYKIKLTWYSNYGHFPKSCLLMF